MEKKLVYFSVVVLMISLMTVSVTSAGYLDRFITGRVSAGVNVSVGITGIHPISDVAIDAIDAQTPTENGITYVPATVRVTDSDGGYDVESVSIVFTKSGEATRSDSSCDFVSAGGDTAVFLCNVSMWYYDLNADDWSALATATDKGNGSYINSTPVEFIYGLLKAMTISPSSISWGTLDAGDTDQSAIDDPTVITNTGNYNDTVGLTGLNLLGANSIDIFPATDFAVGVSDPACGGDQVNVSPINVTDSISSRGLGATEEFYYCVPTVPNIPTQEYSTANAGGSWIVSY